MAQLNTAFYCFTPLRELPALKRSWLPLLRDSGVKGTIILAPEGINGFLAGPGDAVRQALALIRGLPPLGAMRVKESLSPEVPFRDLCIKLKKEIVTFRNPGISLELRPAKRIQPRELRDWYAEGRSFLALDTRNEYEAKLGTFENAVTLGTRHFTEFAEAARSAPETWKKMPVVAFCTGGIRCEKAAPYLESMGFENVLQLEGGILGYFEKVGGAHWQGECFVFDERVALGPDLRPTGATLCGACQWPVPEASPACIHCGHGGAS
jgi:UPF0176 protein